MPWKAKPDFLERKKKQSSYSCYTE